MASTGHLDAPWVAAHLAVLNEAAIDVRLDVDFQLLAAKRTRDQELVWHCRHPTAMLVGQRRMARVLSADACAECRTVFLCQPMLDSRHAGYDCRLLDR